MISKFAPIILPAILLLPSGAAWAHMDLVYAKVKFLPRGLVEVTQQVDFAQNPSVTDEAAAKQILPTCLGLDRGKGWEPLQSVWGAPTFETREDLDETTPPKYRFASDHQEQRKFMTATWRGKPAEPLVFSMPEHFPLDTLLWTVPGDGNMDHASVFYLLPGEKTFTIPLEVQRVHPATLAWAVVAGLLGLLGILAVASRGKSKKTS